VQQLVDDQEHAERGQGAASQALGSFAPPLADPAADGQPDLGSEQGLDCDRAYHRGDREAGQAQAEADREFVDTDRQAQGDDADAPLAEQVLGFAGFAVVVSQQPPGTDGEQRGGAR
jgi:hypothetical protein